MLSMATPTKSDVMPNLLDIFAYKLQQPGPLIMGVLNITPDSFSDGGAIRSHSHAVEIGHAMLEQGADIIDIGGESTRPGAVDVPVDEELRRIIPVIEGCVGLGIPVSVDTRKVPVMEACLDLGVVMINDVNGFQSPSAVETIARHLHQSFLCVMHMQGNPQNMQVNPEYSNVLTTLEHFFEERLNYFRAAGVSQTRILLDPGIGFGKTDEHNWIILAGIQSLVQRFDRPLLLGLSRKSLFGRLLGRSPHERLAASLAGAVLAAERGTKILRVHDVETTHDALAVARMIRHYSLAAISD